MSSKFLKYLKDPKVLRNLLIDISTEKFKHPAEQVLHGLERQKALLIESLKDKNKTELEINAINYQIDEIVSDIIDTKITISVLDINDKTRLEERVSKYEEYEKLKKKVNAKKEMLNFLVADGKSSETLVQVGLRQYEDAVRELMSYKIKLIEESTLISLVGKYQTMMKKLIEVNEQILKYPNSQEIRNEKITIEKDLQKLKDSIPIDNRKLAMTMIASGYKFKNPIITRNIEEYKRNVSILENKKKLVVNARGTTSLNAAKIELVQAKEALKRSVEKFSTEADVLAEASNDLSIQMKIVSVYTKRDINYIDEQEQELDLDEEIRPYFTDEFLKLEDRNGLGLYKIIRDLKNSKKEEQQDLDNEIYDLSMNLVNTRLRYASAITCIWKGIDFLLEHFYIGHNFYEEVKKGIIEFEEEFPSTKSIEDQVIKIKALTVPDEIREFRETIGIFEEEIELTKEEFIALIATTFLTAQEREPTEAFWKYYLQVQTEMERRNYKPITRDVKKLYRVFRRVKNRLSSEFKGAYQEAAEIAMKVSAIELEDKNL